jgi:hypothetical protein
VVVVRMGGMVLVRTNRNGRRVVGGSEEERVRERSKGRRKREGRRRGRRLKQGRRRERGGGRRKRGKEKGT